MLLALLGTSERAPLDGAALSDRLAETGRTMTPARLLAQLLELEAVGHVVVERSPSYRFGLTGSGEAAAYDLGPGAATDVLLVMVDLVGFVAFTAAHGDVATHGAAERLNLAATEELGHRGGRVVKALGDGFLGVIEPDADALAVVQRVGTRCRRPDGTHWPLRAAAHRGRPIQHRGDCYGADVNLVARLCDAARPGELLVSAADPDAAGPPAEPLAVRGLAEPVAVHRMAMIP
ncbi:hypothetical protein BH20ACT2_BH20ACT2_17530 [soil metagenome]